MLPNRLSYPELFSVKYLYDSNPENLEEEAKSAVETLLSLWTEILSGAFGLCPNVRCLSESALRPKYEEVLKELLGSNNLGVNGA